MKRAVVVRRFGQRTECGRQESVPASQLGVVEPGIDEIAGEDDQAAAAPEILQQPRRRGLRQVRHVGKRNGGKIIEPGRGEFGGRDGDRVEIKITGRRRVNRRERVTKVKGIGLQWRPAGMAIHE